MKLHIYVCDPKKGKVSKVSIFVFSNLFLSKVKYIVFIEDCVWEMPRCEPPYRMMKLMKKYSLSLPPPTRAPVIVRKPTTDEENKEETKPITKEHKVYSTKDSLTKVSSTKKQDDFEASAHGDKTAPSVKCIDEDEGSKKTTTKLLHNNLGA